LGRKMAAFPLHPRFSRLFIEASKRGCLHLAVQIAALSQDRSILLPVQNKEEEERRLNALTIPELEESDIYLELKAFQLAEENRFGMDFCRSFGIHAGSARTAARAANQFLAITRRMDLQPEPPEWSDWTQIGKCLLAAFSDQLAKRLDRGTLRCDLVHQRRGTRRRESVVDSEWFIASEIEERNVKGSVQIMLGKNSAVSTDWIEELFSEEIKEHDDLEWDPWQKKVRKLQSKRFRGVAFFEKELMEISKDEAAIVVAQQISQGNIKLKRWNQQVESLIERINFVARHFPEYEISPIENDDRTLIIEQLIYGKTTEKELNQLEVLPAIMDWLSPEQVPMLEINAPEVIKTNGKGKLKIRYEDGKAILSARIQQLYDRSPVLIGNRVPVTYELLAPNYRPVQVTDDLESFWENSYPMIKKELKGRYPRHEWR
ncbi:MAG: helicase, partial [Opitutales bacterium]|nr:helicase [Opitutales bacterium]